MAAVEFWGVDILFGKGRPDDADHRAALGLMDLGHSRDDILARTGVVVGVSNARLKIEEGEICVLMGLSGSGKSTLLRAVNGLNKVTRGKVLIRHGEKAIDVATCDAATLRMLRQTRIAMVFQQFALLPWRTVRENVGFGLELKGVSAQERRRIVDEKLKLVALDRWADKYASELSGGMQQRVGLARAFATDADILLMDEPFSALDPLIRTKLQDELLELQKAFRKTIIFVSHDLDEALKIGNQIAILEGGRIVQAGRPDDIVLRPGDDYVREFVAHMNPLTVLKGGAVMAPLAILPREGGEVVYGGGAYRLVLDDSDRPLAARGRGETLPLEELATAPAATPLKDIIALRHATGHPVLVVEDGRLLGLCGDEQLYAALLGGGRG